MQAKKEFAVDQSGDVDGLVAFRELLTSGPSVPFSQPLLLFPIVFRSRLALVRVYRSSSSPFSLSAKGLDDLFDDRFSKDLFSKGTGLIVFIQEEIKPRTVQ